MSILVGIAGKKQVGKSTVADRLVDHGFSHVSFAAPIKRMIRSLLHDTGLNVARIRAAQLHKEDVLPRIGVSYRELCQTLGTEWGRSLSPDLWLLCAEQVLGDLAGVNVVFDDVRFENEAAFIRARGGLIVHLDGNAGRKPEGVDTHISEAGIKRHECDAVLTNNGTLEDLFSQVFTAIGQRFGEAMA